MDVKLKVEKRDTSLEDFYYDKLLASISKTGLDIKKAEEVANDIVSWAQANAVNGIVTSVELRDAVTKRLLNDYPAEAENYSVYKKE